MPGAVPHQPICTETPVGELRVDLALARILGSVKPISSAERVTLWGADGRVLAEDVRAPKDVPSHDNSAMDGYAIRGEDIPAKGAARLTLIGHALAGRPYEGAVAAGECVGITTGAALPAGADTVVMLERTEAAGTTIQIDDRARPGENLRRAGEDVRAGSIVAGAGTRLAPALLGVIASLGRDAVQVYRRPRVALLSTGDEVHQPGAPLAAGGVYDSNRYTLAAMLAALGVDLIDFGAVPDDPQRLRAALAEAGHCSDMVISSGGVSVGEADFVKPILAELGAVDFWRLAIKPGRPLTFGTLGAATFFGLPGNPVAAMVTFLQFVRPALQRLAGTTPEPLTRLAAVCTERLPKRPGRREFQRGIAFLSADRELRVKLVGRQGSGVLSSMVQANCLVVLAEDRGSVEPGERVSIELLPWATIRQAAADAAGLGAAAGQEDGGRPLGTSTRR
jgi:molybdopterin molybdotransferase